MFGDLKYSADAPEASLNHTAELFPFLGYRSLHEYSVEPGSGFVRPNGTSFELDGKPFFFAGTNAWYLGQPDKMTDDEISSFFQQAAGFGLRVVRFFAFSNGYGRGTPTPNPVQPTLGVYSESALRRIDLILHEAANYGIRILMTLSNFEPFLGGWQWWVDQIAGSGYPMELFMVDDSIKCAWQDYVRMLITRVNTLTGIENDPTIFALELANEPHTNKLYERTHSLTPGRMALGWLAEAAAFVRSIDGNHMISTGEEGYRADGPTDCCQGLQWLNGGFKGVDFARNTALENISFATVHIYPDNWEVPADSYEWVIPNFLDDRANIAHAAGKPIIMEEFGMKTGYLESRDTLLHDLGFAAVEAGYAGMLVWELDFTGPDYSSANGSYTFQEGDPGTFAMRALADWAWEASTL